MRWMEPYGKARSVALVTHGLNMRPTRMAPIIELLREQGAVTALFALPGHRGGWKTLARARAEETLASATKGCTEVARVKRQRSLPVARFVGHSLGALLFLTLFAERRAVGPGGAGSAAPRELAPFDEAILLAPAVALRRRATLLRPPAMRLAGTLPIPSLAPRADAVYPALPLGSYRLLYELLRRFRENSTVAPVAMPMRIYLDRADEFVSLTGIRRLRRCGRLSQATMVIAPEEEHLPWPAHMLAGPESMGATLWDDLRRHLTAAAPPQHTLREANE
ncbi:MAG: hypothetical protein ACLFPW_02720 [Spirochaetaceae bacterium]